MLDQLQVGPGISHFHVNMFTHAAHCKEQATSGNSILLYICIYKTTLYIIIRQQFISRHRASKVVQRSFSHAPTGPAGTTSTTCSHGLAYIVGLSI